MNQLTENDTPKRRVAATMSATDEIKRSWIDMSCTEVFQRGTPKKSIAEQRRSKSKISMARQNFHPSIARLSFASLGQQLGSIKSVSEMISPSEENSDSDCDYQESLSLPSDGSSLRSSTLDALLLSKGSKLGSSYMHFDAVPRTPFRQEKSRWSRESRESLKIKKTPCLRSTEVLEQEEERLGSYDDRTIKFPPQISRITEPLANDFLPNRLPTKKCNEESGGETSSMGGKEKKEEINDYESCDVMKSFVTKETLSNQVPLPLAGTQLQERDIQVQASMDLSISFDGKSQDNKGEESQMYVKPSGCVEDAVKSASVESAEREVIQSVKSSTVDSEQKIDTSRPFKCSGVAEDTEHKSEVFYPPASGASMISTEPLAVDENDMPLETSINFTANKPNSNGFSPPFLETAKLNAEALDDEGNCQTTVPDIETPTASASEDEPSVPSFKFVEALDNTSISAPTYSATAYIDKSPSFSCEAVEFFSETSKGERQDLPSHSMHITHENLPEALTSDCFNNALAVADLDAVKCTNSSEKVALEPSNSSDNCDLLEPHIECGMQNTAIACTEPEVFMPDSEAVQLDATVLKVPSVQPVEQPLFVPYSRAPLIETENGTQMDESLTAFNVGMQNTAIACTEPEVFMPDSEAVQLDATVLKVPSVQPVEQPLFVPYSRAPLIETENGTQMDESLTAFNVICDDESSIPVTGSSPGFSATLLSSDNEGRSVENKVKEKKSKMLLDNISPTQGFLTPSVNCSADQNGVRIQKYRKKQAEFASSPTTVVLHSGAAPYWRIGSNLPPQLTSDDLVSENPSSRSYYLHTSGQSSRITPITSKISANLKKKMDRQNHYNPPKNVVNFAPSISSSKSRFDVVQCKNLNSGLSFLSSSANAERHHYQKQVKSVSRSSTPKGLSTGAGNNGHDSSSGFIIRVYD